MKRNTAKEKKKRNKGFPYKSRQGGRANPLKSYAIVEVGTGKTIKICRTKEGARYLLQYYDKKRIYGELEVKKL